MIVNQATRIGEMSFADYLERALREVAMWSLFFAAFYLIVSLTTYSSVDPGWSYIGAEQQVSNAGGYPGAWFSDVALSLFGYFAYLIPVMVVWSAWMVFRQPDLQPDTRAYLLTLRWFGFFVTLAAGCGYASIHFVDLGTHLRYGTGGGLGSMISNALIDLFNPVGATLLLFGVFFSGFTLFSGVSWIGIMDAIGGGLLDGYRLVRGQILSKLICDDEDEDGPLTERREPAVSYPPALEAPTDIGIAGAWDRETRPSQSRDDDMILVSQADDGLDAVFDTGPVIGPESVTAPESAAFERPHADSVPDMAPVELAELMEPAELVALAATAKATDPVRKSVLKLPNALDSLASFLRKDKHQTTPQPVAQSLQPKQSAPAAPSSPPRSLGLDERPPLELLDEARKSGKGYSQEHLEELSRQVEVKLADFGVEVRVEAVYPGPVVTLFELELAPGTKSSKITGLSKDLARALSTISVRVVEVIPGKSVIGLEIPNEQREIVFLSEVLGAKCYSEATSPLTLSLGTNISGQPVVADLARMPHALIAGTTGSGKSVAINAMILSLIYKAGPEDVRLIMVDPKMLELSVYEGIPHLLTPVVTDMKEAANALRWCVGEMERRYRLMSKLGVRNIKGYNRQVADAEAAGEPIPDPTYAQLKDMLDEDTDIEIPTLGHLPYIVVIIDELADMMMVVGKKVEELIARLAQKARASGIHLLLATQRPSVDVLTGLIKANIPTRMAFQVSSRIDSRTVLDQMGAEQLLGHGDMLYMPPGGSIPQRVHGAFVDDHEVHNVVEYLKQFGGPDYIDDVLREPTEVLPGIDPEPKGDVEDADPLFDEAVQIVVESRRASISGVQRRLKIGYNRAARMIEEMERIGVVGAAETNGNREVLAPPPPAD